MKPKIFLITLLLVMPVVAEAQNDTSEQDSGVLSSLPDIQINSADSYNNSTRQASGGQSTLSWIIILVLVFLGVVLYSFKIDPKWVVLLIGAAALIFFLNRVGLMPV